MAQSVPVVENAAFRGNQPPWSTKGCRLAAGHYVGMDTGGMRCITLWSKRHISLAAAPLK